MAQFNGDVVLFLIKLNWINQKFFLFDVGSDILSCLSKEKNYGKNIMFRCWAAIVGLREYAKQ